MGFRFSASCNGKREGKALKIKKKREGLAGFHGIQFQENDIEFGGHGSLGHGEAELSYSEFDNGGLKAI